MNYKITEDRDEIIAIGRQIATDNPRRYPRSMFDDFKQEYYDFLPDDDQLASNFYSAIYHRQVYGTSLIEYPMYHFVERTHAEKCDYVTWFSRYIYMAYLNRQQDWHFLDNKYEAYTLLKPFYKRDAMLLTDECDFAAFCSFAERHHSIFVKPVNLDLAEGVHRLVIDNKSDLKTVFRSLMDEAKGLASVDVTRPIDHRLILEEEIRQSEEMAQLNPYEMSLLRVTTLLIKDKIHFFYPCIRIMTGDGMSHSGEMYSVEALVDAERGIVLTDGMESRWTIECHPVTGTRIKGFVLPEWKELLQMLEKAARSLPTLRYIGWDVAHTDNGWCIIEGNPNGELCMSQMCVGHGLKRELEELIGFNIPFGFMLENVEQIIEDKKYEKKD